VEIDGMLTRECQHWRSSESDHCFSYEPGTGIRSVHAHRQATLLYWKTFRADVHGLRRASGRIYHVPSDNRNTKWSFLDPSALTFSNVQKICLCKNFS
jgi:hypothetical protein